MVNKGVGSHGQFDRLYVYLFVIVIVLYIVGASIYQAFLWFRKWQEKKRDEKFSMDNEENKE